MKGIERQRVGMLPVWGWAIVASAIVWLLYAFTLGPTTAFWDTSEYITTAYILGLPHPPGNPLFVLFGRTWLILTGWTGLEVATRINLMSATMSATAAGFWFLAVMRIWAHFTENRTVALTAAFVSVLVGATAYTVWAQSNVNEKVYTVSLTFVAVISYLAMLWEDHSDTWRGDRIFLLVLFLLGFGWSNHQMSILPILALFVFLLWHSWKTLLRPGLLGAGVVLLIVGYSVQLLFVPIRSAQNPIIDEADPECPVLLTAIIPDFKATLESKVPVPTCDALSASIRREQYLPPPLSERQAPFKAQFGNWIQYFDWQWARTLMPPARHLVTFLFLAFGLVGLWRHARGDPDSFVYFFTLLISVSVVLVYYLNFKYGYTQAPDLPIDRHEVRERDYFFVLSFNLWGLYAGMGIVTAWQSLARRLARGWDGDLPTREHRGLRAASPLLGIALIPLVLNFQLADRRGDYSARDWAYNLLQSVEPYSILFTNGDNDTFPLWYLQEVEGIRRDVTVIVHSYLGTKWYPKQLRGLTAPCPDGVDPLEHPTVIVCQRPFDRDAAIALYAEMDASPPTRPILSLTDEQIDAIPIYEVAPAGFEVQMSPTIKLSYPDDRVFTHPDLLVLRIIRESLGDRPIYFAATAPPVYQVWELEEHMVRQGLALRLVQEPLEETADRVALDPQFGVRWIDL
ncbi:MAG: glycosyltransferase family 117 protein, partial [Gemmatimonadota bacterium]